jgi:hypothetical protein
VRSGLALLIAASFVALVPLPTVRAQTTPTDDSSGYWQWRAAHVDRAEQALAAQVAAGTLQLPCGLPAADPPPAAPPTTVDALVSEALAVRPPQELIFVHGEYLLALEQLRLAVEALRARSPNSRRASEAAALVCERLTALDALRAPGAAASPPTSPTLPSLPLSSRPSAPLTSAEREGVQVAILDVRRPYVPPEGAPSDPVLEYLLVRFRLTNGGARPLPYYPLADFELRLPDASALHPLALGSAERSTSGELAPGDGLIAEVTFLVPRDVRPLVLRLTPADGPTVDLALP